MTSIAFNHNDVNSTSSSLDRFLNTADLPRPLISDETRGTIIKASCAVLCALNLMGVLTNAVNMRVFINQGLPGNSSTISLFSLATVDLGACLFLVPCITCPIIASLGDTRGLWNCVNIVDLALYYPHLIFSRLTCWITIYVSIERSLSVLMPMKVRDIFKPRVTVAAISALSLLIILMHVGYPVSTIHWVHSDVFDAKVAVNMPSSVYDESLVLTSIAFDIITPTAVVAIVAPTFILMVNTLRKSRKFRQSSSSAGGSASRGGTKSENEVKDDSATSGQGKQENKDVQIVKTIALLWGVFLFCQIMGFVPGIAFIVIPHCSIGQLNENVVYVSYYYKFFFDSINSSTNMFVYITVSSRYKAAFNRVFRAGRELSRSGTQRLDRNVRQEK